MRVAITREVSPALARCELTHLERVPIDVAIARRQHRAYEECLASLGCSVRRLPGAPELPDSVFIEDTAVVVDEVAVIARPGAPSRRPEVPAVAAALEQYRPLVRIEAPGTLDGGDVLQVGREVLVGCSGRTNADGIAQLRRMLGAHGYAVRAVRVHGCLHLKSAVTAVADDLLLANRQWLSADDLAALDVLDVLDVHPEEPFGANALRVGDAIVYAAELPRTRERLEARGLAVHAVPAGELAKAEGGVTCCSLVFESMTAGPASPRGSAPTPASS
jgi:dimethylargininase